MLADLQGLHCKYIYLLNKAFSLNSYYTHMEAFRIYGMPGIHIYRSISGCPHFGIYNSFLRRTHLHKRDAVHTVLLFLCVYHQHYRLHVPAVAELVHTLYLLYFVTVSYKKFKIPCECCGITAYIHDSLRCHLDHGVK